MAVDTWLDIYTEDAQGVKSTFSARINPVAFNITQALPTEAAIEAVITALFGDTKLSTSIVTGYAVRVVNTLGAALGGAGDVSSSTALRIRNNQANGPFLLSVPGAAKSNLLFDVSNPSSISTTGALWTALRAALVDAEIAVSAPTGAYAAIASEFIAENASIYDGRRAQPRAR